MKTVFVAGSINMDIVAKATRHPRIGETVAGRDMLFLPGGKGANQAISSARLGVPTILIGKLGTDAFGRELRNFLSGEGIDLQLVQNVPGVPTGTAVVTVADGDNTIVVVPGANAQVTIGDVETAGLSRGDVAVAQFEIPLATVAAFFQRARSAGATTILNPAPAREFDHDLLRFVDIVILNESELGLLSGKNVNAESDSAEIVRAAESLRAFAGQVICVTLGERGILALVEEKTIAFKGHSVRVIDTTGAGDCFVGAVAARLAAGEPLDQALSYANSAASICVQRIGAGPSMPTGKEVQQSIAAGS